MQPVYSIGAFGLVLASALGYSIATIGMKLGVVSLSTFAGLLIVGGLAMAVIAEMAILRHMDLGRVYLAIIATETLVVLTFAAMIGEGLNLRQLGGAAVIVAGLAIVSH